MFKQQRLLTLGRTKLRFGLLAFTLFLQSQAGAQSIAPVGPSPSSGGSNASIGALGSSSSALRSSLDLSSTKSTISASGIKGLNSATIKVGSKILKVTNSSLLTPAEAVAVRQVINNGSQNLVLNAVGGATGGVAQINHLIGSLVVPHGVTVFTNAANGDLSSMSGGLNNSGTIIEFAPQNSVGTAMISAAYVVNQRGALISTVLQNVALSIYNPNQKLNLTINSLGNITNYGTISSAGTLTLNAVGSISNGQAGLAAAVVPALIQSQGNLFLNSQAGSITNAGLVSSMKGNININALSSANLSINNNGGILEALNGQLNIGNQNAGSANITTLISGGTLSAQTVNVYSGAGNANIDVQTINGPLNLNAGSAHVNASSSLELGAVNVPGDPTFTTHGDMVLTSPYVYSGQDLAIVASGSILSGNGAGAIDTSSATGNGGEITIIAGVNFTYDAVNNVVTMTGPSATGGFINLDESSGKISSLNSSSSAAGGKGGDIRLYAFAGSKANSGTIQLPSSVTIKSGGSGTGADGVVRIFGGASFSPYIVAALNVGPIDTTGGAPGSGGISIGSDQLTASGPLKIVNGAFSGGFDSGAYPKDGRIAVNGSLSSDGAIELTTYARIDVKGDINTSINAASGKAGTIYVVGNDLHLQNVIANGSGGASPGSIYLYANSKLTTNGYISATTSSTGKQGGYLNLYANGFYIDGTDAGGNSLNVSSSAGKGGRIDLNDASHTAFNVGNLRASGDGTKGSISATGIGAQGGSLNLTCCGNLFIFSPAVVNPGPGGTLVVKNCETGQNIAPIIVAEKVKVADDKKKKVTIVVSRVKGRLAGSKPDPTKAPTDVTFSAPGGDDPDDIPDIGDTDEKARIPIDDKLIRGIVLRRTADINKETSQLSADGFVIAHTRHDTTFDINSGNALLLPDKALEVGFQMGGKMQIAAGSAVFVIDKGDDLEVLDFHDRGPGSVRIMAQGRDIKLSPGKVLVLTKKDVNDFKRATLTPKVAFRNAKGDSLGSGVKAFAADFSIPSGLLSIVPLREFIKNATGSDRQIIAKILKNSAIIGDVTPFAGPYSTGSP